MSYAHTLVPVEESATLRRTVAHAVDSAIEAADGDARITFASVLSADSTQLPGSELEASAEDLLDRIEIWAEEDAGDAELTIDTVILGADEYLFSPQDMARVIGAHAVSTGVDRIVLDPEYDPGAGQPLLEPLKSDLSGDDRFDVEEAPVEHPRRSARIVAPSSASRFIGTFVLSFVFYQLIGGFAGLFDIVTGAATALIAAITLSQVTFSRRPQLVGSFVRLGRWFVFAPVLLWEILIANLQVAAVILDPRKSIDPRMTRVHAAVWGVLPVTTLANSITLTPGTLTVRERGQDLYVHSLLPVSREGLFDGGLERWVRFVFYGRRSMRIDSPKDRGDAEVLQSPEDGDDAGGEDA
ncbi:multisubunit sodium/proton antiporter, MrpE subunit [Natronoarchaeum philippinense]|uniref:Multisubunit sodium/proton antiporter, MrpE subunit n=1 Tax=Natronoarchaeum philippinense TaxID=558529 RepID=A0A285MZS3_NATPI|nr:monovalent cation/H+ antiporter subunit E [Natronoarchaeum philippinense]SNZ02598.1 multisubunit sodium/proton antiporter, MrpE subunit [Natronoarchaeum philippinense]